MAAMGARVSSSSGTGVFKVLVGDLFLVLHARPPIYPHMLLRQGRMGGEREGERQKRSKGGGGLTMHECPTTFEGVSTIENCTA